uniref:Uncharacterized protein n=1 Tax=Populus trichocarpa TaxID=3694 RepID=B9NBL4_POPTR
MQREGSETPEDFFIPWDVQDRSRVLAQNIELVLKNPSVREQMGIKGSKKVEKMYLKRHMYKKFGEVLYKCMRVK